MKKLFTALLVLFIGIGLVGCNEEAKSTTITIKPVGNTLAYETTTFEVSAGQEVTLVMENVATAPVMKHNIVILSDKTKINEVGQAAMSAAPSYVPEHPAIIAATPLADAGQTTQVTFTAPTEPGEYVYVCTFPGHFISMRGTMVVK